MCAMTEPSQRGLCLYRSIRIPVAMLQIKQALQLLESPSEVLPHNPATENRAPVGGHHVSSSRQQSLPETAFKWSVHGSRAQMPDEHAAVVAQPHSTLVPHACDADGACGGKDEKRSVHAQLESAEGAGSGSGSGSEEGSNQQSTAWGTKGGFTGSKGFKLVPDVRMGGTGCAASQVDHVERNDGTDRTSQGRVLLSPACGRSTDPRPSLASKTCKLQCAGAKDRDSAQADLRMQTPGTRDMASAEHGQVLKMVRENRGGGAGDSYGASGATLPVQQSSEQRAEFPVDARHLWETQRGCLLYTSPSPRDRQKSRMPSSA